MYLEHREAIDFADVGVARLAADVWTCECIAYSEAFDSIFGDWEMFGGYRAGIYVVNAETSDVFVVHGEMIDALREYCETGLRETVQDYRDDDGAPHTAMSAAERNVGLV